MVNLFFRQGQYPDVNGLVGGNVVMGCWMKEFTKVEEVLDALETQMPIYETHEAIP